MIKTRKTIYYGSKLSENMTETPEGFLLCLNVPIGRTGSQEYLGQELGMEYGKRYEVLRTEEEVFSVAAMASFEGKPFCDEHPSNEVTPENATQYTKGNVRNVRRGSGEQSDLLLADIIVYDKAVINAIRQGKREVSCGYNCLYEPAGEYQLKQTSIIGNHVALVEKGRAGSRVAIKDELPEKRREKQMETKSKKSILGRMFGAYAQDATPEELELAVDEIVKVCTDEETAPTEPVKETPVQDEGEENSLEARMDRLEAAVGKLVQALAPKEEPNALDALETELAGKVEEAESADEESVTVEPETVNQENQTVDHAALLAQIGALKPIVAQIKDPAERKRTADTLAGILRQSAGVGKPADNQGYLDLYQASMQHVEKARKTMDAAGDERELGRKIAREYNPHYKKEEK